MPEYTSPRFDNIDAANGARLPNVFTSFHEFKAHAHGILSCTFVGPQKCLTFRGKMLYNSPETQVLLDSIRDMTSSNFRAVTFDPYFTNPAPLDQTHLVYTFTLATFNDMSLFRQKYDKAIRKIYEDYRVNVNKLRAATTVAAVESTVVQAFAPPYNVPGFPQDSWPEFVHSTVYSWWGGEFYTFPIDNL